MTGITAVCAREGRSAWADPRNAWNATAYAFTLSACCLIILALRGFDPSNAQSSYQTGRDVFIWFGGLQLFLVSVLGPGFTSPVLAEERQNGTLGLILLSRLAPYEIVLGKFIAHGSLPLLGVAAGLPILLLITTLGGVSPAEIAAVYAVLVSASMLGAAIGCWASARSDSTLGAMVVSLSLWGALVLGPTIATSGFASPPPILQAIAACSPIGSLQEIQRLGGGGVSLWTTSTIWWYSVVTCLGLTVVVLAAAALRLPSESETERPGILKRLVEAMQPYLHLTFAKREFFREGRTTRFYNPFTWKEANARPILKWSVVEALVLAFTLALVLLDSTVPDFRKSQDLQMVVLLVMIGSLFLMATVLSATAITTEKEHKSLHILLTTPMSPFLFLYGKFYGVLGAVWICAIPVLLHSVVVWMSGGLDGLSLMAIWVCLPTILACQVAHGLYASLICRTTPRSVSLALGGSILFWIVQFVATPFCCLLGAINPIGLLAFVLTMGRGYYGGGRGMGGAEFWAWVPAAVILFANWMWVRRVLERMYERFPRLVAAYVETER